MLLTEVNDEVHCSGCGKGFPGPIYGCSACRFHLHKSCAELPREIQNFFHPCLLVLNIGAYICNASFKYGSGLKYRCTRCDFDMHVKCTQRPTVKSKEEDLIHHFTHWHPLTLVDQNRDSEVGCRICDNLCPGNSNSCAYGCEEYRCLGCDEDSSGLVFRCGKCPFQLDVKCALLPTIESKGADKIQHSSHQHPLALRENIQCAVEFPQEIHHPFHPLHPLTLSSLPPDPNHNIFRCHACLGLDDRFLLVYRCAECEFNLHTDCANPKLTPLLLKYEAIAIPISKERRSIKGRAILRDEENSALEAAIVKLSNEIAELNAEESRN
ncbi:hypothetical protein PTKIN_Ptkin04bG0214200 [Pterospermum kingtungense]